MVASGVALGIGALLAVGFWQGLARVYSHPTLQRTNLHGRPVATAGGLVIVLALLVPELATVVYHLAGWDWLPPEALAGWQSFLVLGLGFGILGLIDDLLGDGDRRGFRGHLGALARGELTTGAIKLLGGGAVAVIVAWRHSDLDQWWMVVANAALIALAANLANLFDRAPGRVTKMAVVSGICIVVVAPGTYNSAWNMAPVPMLLVIGAAVGMLLPELREQVMLGDTGANVVGAALGLGAVIGLGQDARLIILAVLVVLNVASERVSFSRVIATTPGLREFDQWGRAPE